MKIYFFDIPNSYYEHVIERLEYDNMSEEEIDKKFPLTGPFVTYADYQKLEQKRGD